MQAVSFNHSKHVAPVPDRRVTERSMHILNQLRMVSLQCRSSARIDLEQACALLLADPADAQLRHAEILMRGFHQAVVKRPVLYRPGTVELSFDEAWLGSLLDALNRGDDDSFQFLIQSRVPRWTRRNLAFLIRSVSDQFDNI